MRAKGCSWLAVVHGYKVSFIPIEWFIRKKLTFLLLFCSLHQSHDISLYAWCEGIFRTERQLRSTSNCLCAKESQRML